MRRHLLLTALGALTVVAVSCGVPLDSSPRSVSVGSAGRPSSQSPRSGGDTNAYLYFVKDDHLVPVDRDVTSPDIISVLKVLIAGPTAQQTTDGLISQIPGGTTVHSVRLIGVTNVVSLSRQFQNVIGTASVEAIAQIVFTVTELDPGGRVQFVVGGQRLKVTSPSRGDVQQVDQCDFVSLLPTDDSSLGTTSSVDLRHLAQLRRSLAKCPPGPSS